MGICIRTNVSAIFGNVPVIGGLIWGSIPTEAYSFGSCARREASPDASAMIADVSFFVLSYRAAQNRIKAQHSGFDPERRNKDADHRGSACAAV